MSCTSKTNPGLPQSRLRQALQPVADEQQDAFHNAVADLGEDLQPVLGALAAVAGPDAQNVAGALDSDRDREVDRVSSMPVSRRRRFLTSCGSKPPSVSRGTAVSTGPTSFSTVLDRFPLRQWPPFFPAASRFAQPRRSAISSSRANSNARWSAVRQPALTGQLQSPGTGPLDQHPDQLVINGRSRADRLRLGRRLGLWVSAPRAPHGGARGGGAADRVRSHRRWGFARWCARGTARAVGCRGRPPDGSRTRS